MDLDLEQCLAVSSSDRHRSCDSDPWPALERSSPLRHPPGGSPEVRHAAANPGSDRIAHLDWPGNSPGGSSNWFLGSYGGKHNALTADGRVVEPWSRSTENASGTCVRCSGSESCLPSGNHSFVPRVRTAFTWRVALILLHFSGAMLISAWFALQAFRLVLVRKRAQPPGDAIVPEVFGELMKELGLRRTPELLLSAEVPSPLAFGILRPTILLPESLVTCFASVELRTVLAHELAHFRRRDLWVNALELILVAVWWFHPCIWILRRALRRTREDCCDDLLLARGLTSNQTYCDVLVRAARKLAACDVKWAALGFGGKNLPPAWAPFGANHG